MTDDRPHKAPSPPTSLRSAGKELWKRLNSDVSFEDHERPLVLLACKQADDLRTLEELLEQEGPSVIGSTGQQRLNPIFAELRQGRLALGKLVAQLQIPDVEQQLTPSQQRAARAAEARWAPIRGPRGQAS